MTRAGTGVVLMGAVYCGLALLFVAALASHDLRVAWVVWFFCSVGALSNCALELTGLPVWLALKATGEFNRDKFVPLTLSSADCELLNARRPTAAILIPAHKEATTAEDRQALVERLLGIIDATPSWSVLYLLFDSPKSERRNESWVVSEVRRRLGAAGRAEDVCRLQYEEYREKPKHMRNKPGSICLWLDRIGNQFEFMFVLDADSSLPAPESPQPERRDILERLVVAMLRHSRLGMIQTSIHIRSYATFWGWFQSVNTRMGARYHGPLYQWALAHGVPSYGHSVLFRTADFRKHAKNTLHYLSHDFLDAADLAAGGKSCIHTHRAVTYELAEESLLGYLSREWRWSKGNFQWVAYWLTKKRLPVAPRLFLAVGIMFYVWPLLTTLMIVSSVFLISDGVQLFANDRPGLTAALLGAVLTSLLLPRALASRSLTEFCATTLIGVLVSPSLMLLRGIAFLLGAFGSEWKPRGARGLAMDFDHVSRLVKLFYPLSLFGLALEAVVLTGNASRGPETALIQIHILLLIASPIVACLLSYPIADPRRFIGVDNSPTRESASGCQ